MLYIEHSTRSDALPEGSSKCSAREGLVLSGEKLVCMQVGRVRVAGFVGWDITQCCCAVCSILQTIYFAKEGVVSVTDQRCLMLVQE